MQKKMTISISEPIYDGLISFIGRRKISKFIEDMVRPYVIEKSLEDGYKAMANDIEREQEALEWCNALSKDFHEASR